MKSYGGDGGGSSRRDGGWHSSASSVGGGGSGSIGRFPRPNCGCKVECAIYTSKTNMNPNRQFFGCSYYKERKPHCSFFCWVDEWEERIPNKSEVEDVKVEDVKGMEQHGKVMEHSREMDQIHSKLNEMQLQIKELQINMKEMELKMKEVMGGNGNDVCVCKRVGVAALIISYVVVIVLTLFK